MAAISTTDLFKAYLAYFGRPPDVAGLSFYTTANGGVPEKDVVNGFYASAESQAFFGSMPLAEQINQIYNNLFNRDVEADGLLYWMSRIQGDIVVNGVVVPQLNLAEAAMGILRGAQNGDLDTVNAKVAASQRFVEAMDTAPEWSGYAGEEAANDAREFLAGVGVGSTPTDAEVNAAVLKATTPNIKYEVAANAAQINEGQTVVFTISTTNVPEGTLLSYEITGINAADLQSGNVTGTVNVDKSGQALVQVTLKADLTTEGLETMTLTVGENLASASVGVLDTSVTPPPPPVPSYDVAPSATSVSEGQTVIFTISTENVPENTLLSYEITGINAADLQSGLLVGTVLIDETGQALVQVTLKNDLTTEGVETMTFTLGAGLKTVQVSVQDTSGTPPVQDQILVATNGIDVLYGGPGNDTFIATNATLQNGDRFYGEQGVDQLNVAISSQASSFMDGFKTSSVEVIRVNNISQTDTTVVVADVGYNTQDGKVELFSDDSWGDVTFMDIQNISDTKLHVKDTADATYFGYDTGNSAQENFDNGNGQEGDHADLTVSEMRGTVRDGANWYTGLNGNNNPNMDFGRPGVDGAYVELYNSDLATDSYVDRITLHSDITGQVSTTKKNTMQLVAGEDLDVLVIDGDADLEITNVLDENIRLVDASAHRNFTNDARADLILDLSDSSDGRLFADDRAFWTDDPNLDGYVSGDAEMSVVGKVDMLTVLGSQGDDLITTVKIARDERADDTVTWNDKLVDLGTGNDTLVAAGWVNNSDAKDADPFSFNGAFLFGGEASINAGNGNDWVTTGNLNDIVMGGEGNDNITDGGSTALWTPSGNFGVSPTNIRYAGETAWTVAGNNNRLGNQFDLGAGDDSLMVYSAPNRYSDWWIWGSNNSVTAGTGNDTVDIDGSAIDGNYTQPGYQRVDTIVDLGLGDDHLTIGDGGVNTDITVGSGDDIITGTYRDFGTMQVDYSADNNFGVISGVATWGGSRGNVLVTGGPDSIGASDSDADSITINRDGTHTVNSGAGNDTVMIHGDENTFESVPHWDASDADGAHKITLGTGDDHLWITGRSVTNTTNPVVITTDIDAGSGDDYIQLEQDHRLNVKLGDGADRIMMRAQDLQSADTIQGGNNYKNPDEVNDKDTIYLTNETHSSWNGFVDRSDTNHVYSIEEYWLLDSNIRLNLDNHMFETAADRSVVVDTTLSSFGEYPINLGVQANDQVRYQGMLWILWDGGYPEGTAPDVVNVGNDNNVNNDVVFFKYAQEPKVLQTIDLSEVDTYDYKFELRGGSLKDLVIVDDDALSADVTLNFDAGTGDPAGPDSREAWAYTDTLRVLDAATLRADDMERVTNLEIIELAATQDLAQEYVIELNTHVINQPTGTSALYIRIDPNVPAGSKVAIVFSENSTAFATNNVIVERTSNVQVYISKDNGDPFNGSNLVTEPEMNTGTPVETFKGSGFGVVVNTLWYFTENTDNLVGKDAFDDVFIAQSLDQVQTADSVDGKSHVNGDTVRLMFAVANGAESLDNQLQNVTLNNIEILEFATENNVTFASMGGIAPGLDTLISGMGADDLNIERDNLWIVAGEGNDTVDFIDGGGDGVTVDGGSGSDTVLGTDGDDGPIVLGRVEYVATGDGADYVRYTTDSGLGGNDGNITVIMGDFSANPSGDVLVLDNNGTNGVASVDGAETLYGGDGVDTIYATQVGSRLWIYGDGDSNGWSDPNAGANDSIDAVGGASTNITIYGEQGADWIRANTTGGPVWIDGGSENDTIIGGTGTPNNVTVYGQTGSDHISVTAQNLVYVSGGEDGDTILVKVGNTPNSATTDSVWGANVNDAVAGGSVYGDGGDDVITVWTQDNVTVSGGTGADTMTVYSDDDASGGVTYIYGNEGNDSINVRGDAMTMIYGGADNSNDTINLQALGSNVDTIVFGNIVYGADQFTRTTDTQGKDVINGFNFEQGVGPDTASPGPDDVMDFSDFLVGAGINVGYADWKPSGPSGVADIVLAGGLGGGRSNVVVLATDNTYELADLANDIYLVGSTTNSGIWAQDGSRFVVITAQDPNQNDGTVGYKDYDVYFVQDVDSQAGSAVWRIDLVATIDAATYSGAITGVNAGQFVNN